MTDVDERLRSELDSFVPRDSRRDWEEIAATAGLKRERARRRGAFVAVGSLAAAAVLAVSTPLGSALVRSFDDFSAWLSGEPGTPASEEEQREFEQANARSWLRFPEDTRLRELITAEAGDSTVTLLGFRSGASALCLRLKVAGETPLTVMSCAPLDELRRVGGPVRPVIVDRGVGKGDKVEWYGIDRIHSTDLQLTAGIAADGVDTVVLEDEGGRHEVPVTSNAFLYVAEQPEVGQRVKRIWARSGTRLTPIPFAPAPFAVGGIVASSRPVPAAPAIEREVTDGRIGWLEDREPRGESLDVLPADFRAMGAGTRRLRGHPDVLFGRVLTPDADRPVRMVLTLNANKPGGPAKGLCTWLVTRGGGGGGCTPYPEIFERRAIAEGLSGEGSRAFVTISGIASDHVARIEALLSDAQRADVPLQDNAFIVDLPRANLPALLVAYDEDGKVIDVSRPLSDFGLRGPGPARGRAESLIRVTGADGATSELFVGPSTDGGECAFVKEYVDETHAGVGTHCRSPEWGGPLVQVGTSWSPPRFVSGRVHPDVKRLRIRFMDGSTTTLVPTRGYILWAVPEKHFAPGRVPLTAEGLGADGSVLARQRLAPPGRATRSRKSSSRD
jgi:hypothetical protein